jgi:hypothetical protein
MRRPTEEKPQEDHDSNVTLVNLAQSRDAKKLKVYATKQESSGIGVKKMKSHKSQSH